VLFTCFFIIFPFSFFMETNTNFAEGRVADAQLTNLFETEELEQRLETLQMWQVTDCADTSNGGNGCVQ
jgi:hypothetical protein